MKEKNNYVRKSDLIIHISKGERSVFSNLHKRFMVGLISGTILLVLPIVVIAQSPVTIRQCGLARRGYDERSANGSLLAFGTDSQRVQSTFQGRLLAKTALALKWIATPLHLDT